MTNLSPHAVDNPRDNPKASLKNIINTGVRGSVGNCRSAIAHLVAQSLPCIPGPVLQSTPVPQRPKVNPVTRDRGPIIEEMRRSGFSNEEIGVALGASKNSIAQTYHKYRQAKEKGLL